MYAYMFLLAFLVFHISKVLVTSDDESKMIITYGEPSEIDNCEMVENGDCFSVCYSNDTCMIAYLDDETCYNCVNVTSITKLDSGTSKVGFKTNSTTCSEYPNTTYYNEDYRLEYSDGTWTVEYIGWKCTENYTLFKRTKEYHCLTVVQSTAWYAAANAECETYGGGLSGLENTNEQEWLQETCWKLPESTPDRTYVLVDGQLTQAATNKKLANSNYKCKFPDDYYFMDTSLTNPSLSWYIDNPDCWNGQERCLYMYAHNNDTDLLDGLMNDDVCTKNSTLMLCGTSAYYGY